MKMDQGEGAVVYVRVSTDEQANGPLNLENQEKRCRDFCRQQGWPVVQVFVDRGESARSADRPEFQRMLAYCKANRRKVRYVVVQDLSRFARNVQDQARAIGELERISVLLRSTYESNIDETAAGKMVGNIFGSFNQYFSDSLSEKMKDRTRQAVRAGRFPWRAPIGYFNVSRGDGPNIEPDPDRAPLVRRAFDLMAKGIYKKSEVLKIVTDEGLTTVTGKQVTSQNLHAILLNPLYAGWVTLPSDPGFEPVRGLHEAIVTQSVFDQVQDILSGRKAPAVPKSKFNPMLPLKVLVRCDHCGTPLTGAFCQGRHKKYGHYWCRQPGCHAVKLTKDQLESEFVSLLQTLGPHPEAVSALSQVAAKVWADRQGDVEKQKKKLTLRLQEQKALKSNLLKAMLRGTVKQDQFEEANAEYSADIAATEEELEALGSGQETQDAFVQFAELHLLDIAGAWQMAQPEERKMVQNLLFENGLAYSSEAGILNRSNSNLFSLVEAASVEKIRLASPKGFEPMLPPGTGGVLGR